MSNRILLVLLKCNMSNRILLVLLKCKKDFLFIYFIALTKIHYVKAGYYTIPDSIY